MDYPVFKQAKKFIFSDIDREIALARASQNEEGLLLLKSAGVPTGGGNFLAAMGLLSYTEFFGEQKYKHTGRGCCSKNFNDLFDDLGDEYRLFREAGEDIYSIFRCGLVHEYYTKQDCTIYMLKNERSAGIGKEHDGKYYFVVETYYEALKRVINDIENDLYKKI